MAKIAKKTKRYRSDLTDEEWEQIALLMPAPGRRGRPREADFREVINAMHYLVRSGCGWRMLPIDFGARQTGLRLVSRSRGRPSKSKELLRTACWSAGCPDMRQNPVGDPAATAAWMRFLRPIRCAQWAAGRPRTSQSRSRRAAERV
jgi:transposase